MDLRELPRSDFDRHPWETVRASFFSRLLREHVNRSGLCALDMGAGDGFFAGRLVALVPQVRHVTCFDRGYDEAWLRERTTKPAMLSFTAVRPESRFDVVILLDVLEHVADDRATLREAVSDLLGPRGWLLVSAPAYPSLFSHHDVLLGHKRRYSPGRLRALVREAGLAAVEAGQLFASLILPRALAKLGEVASRRPAPSPAAHVETALGTWSRGPLVTRGVTAALALDALCSRRAARRHLPWPGLSTWVLAQLP